MPKVNLNARLRIVSHAPTSPQIGSEATAGSMEEHQLISDAIRKGLTVQAHNQARALKALDRAEMYSRKAGVSTAGPGSLVLAPSCVRKFVLNSHHCLIGIEVTKLCREAPRAEAGLLGKVSNGLLNRDPLDLIE
jgi:hypothetical protein